MISEKRVEQALAYLVESAEKAAEARAHRLYLDEFTKHLKAKLMRNYPSMAANAQEREALADSGYLTHLDGLGEAIRRDEEYRYRREAESAVIEAYRTFSANTRKVQ